MHSSRQRIATFVLAVLIGAYFLRTACTNTALLQNSIEYNGQQTEAKAKATSAPVDTVYFRNPSFEDTPGASVTPKEWMVKTKGSTPDILPGAWELASTIHAGNTCLGLVVREDNTTEDISQVLSQPLTANECYEFTVWLSKLPKYRGYNHPCRLQVYGGSTGGREVLLASSPLITKTEWTPHKMQFTAKGDVKTICLVAWYGPGMMFKYKGNILIDDLSAIVRCNRA